MNHWENHVDNLTHEEMLQLHRNNSLLVHVRIDSARRFCAFNTVRSHIRINLVFWSALSWIVLLGTLIGAPISLFYIKWYWSLLIFICGLKMVKLIEASVSRTTAEELLRLVFSDPTFYYKCLDEEVLYIKYK